MKIVIIKKWPIIARNYGNTLSGMAIICPPSQINISKHGHLDHLLPGKNINLTERDKMSDWKDTRLHP